MRLGVRLDMKMSKRPEPPGRSEMKSRVRPSNDSSGEISFEAVFSSDGFSGVDRRSWTLRRVDT